MNVADLVINVSQRFSRSAGFQPAVSPISNRQIVVSKRIVEGSDDPQVGSLRLAPEQSSSGPTGLCAAHKSLPSEVSRLGTCATRKATTERSPWSGDVLVAGFGIVLPIPNSTKWTTKGGL